MSHASTALLLRGLEPNVKTEILVAWNTRFRGWTMPGGKSEPGEDLIDTMVRELFEETRLRALVYEHVFEGPSPAETSLIVHVFRVTHIAIQDVRSGGSVALKTTQPHVEPSQGEHGRPVGWMYVEDFLRASPFPEWHTAMVEAVSKAGL